MSNELSPNPGDEPAPVWADSAFGEQGRVQVISMRAVIVGLVVCCLLIIASISVRLAASTGTKKKLVEFKFTIDEPEDPLPELKQPNRTIMQQHLEEPREVIEVEQPDIRMPVVPEKVEVIEKLIEVKTIEIMTPKVTVPTVDVDIDTAEDITEAPEQVTVVRDVIAADAPGPGDIFRYGRPAPREMPRSFTVSSARKPSRAMTALPRAFGADDALSMADLDPANINLFGGGDFYRSMNRMGGPNARLAVDSALQWLALHQEPDGHWDPRKYEGAGNEIGATALALLAFMGGGHTSRTGEHRRNVTRGLEWLLRASAKDGMIGDSMYEHAVVTMAFCEAYGRARDERIGAPARKGIAFLEQAKNNDGGWRYRPKSEMSDVSATGWVIQAMKSAKLAQIEVDGGVQAQALLFLDSLTQDGAKPSSTGAVGYTFEPDQNYTCEKPAMTAAGMLIRQLSGMNVESPLLKKGAALMRQFPPAWEKKEFYTWYYTTYAMHNMGEEDRVWWNRRIRDVLLENQRREGDEAGSWDPKGDEWAKPAGRVYSTALAAMCLEVYYRYSGALNRFGVAPELDDLFLK